MQKLDSLRAALTAALPELATDPTRLRIWIERGQMQSRGTATRALAFAFQANVLIVELATDIAVAAHALFEWARVNQPDLLTPASPGPSFDADILDNETVDLLIQVDLTQSVTVAPADGGGFALQYLAEPDPLFVEFPAPSAPDNGFAIDETLPPETW